MKKYIVLLAGLIAMTGFVHAQAPPSIAGDTVLAAVTSGTPPFATNGYFLFTPADSGSNYQVTGLAHVANSGGTYSYLASGATGTMSLDDDVNGTIANSFLFSSPFQGAYVQSAGPYNQTGTFTLFTNPVPDSIIGQDFYVSIQDGGGVFASNGDFVLSIASSGNAYTITSFSGGVNSQGTYSYLKLNSSCGGITLTDSVTGISVAYLSLSNSDSGVFALTQSSTNFQIGQLTVLTAPLPASFAGEIIFSTITSGTGPLPSHGYNVFVPADSGNSYQSFGITENDYSSGTYSYSSSGPTGTMNLVDSVVGAATLDFFALSPYQGKYVETVGPYTQTADSILFTNPVPDSIAGQDFYVNIQDGGGSFASNGNFVLSVASSGNAYTITATSGGGSNSLGTYSYSILNSSCGGITLTDSVTGVSTVYLCLSNSVSGVFALSQSPGSYQLGQVTLLTAQPLSSLVGDTILAAVNSGTGPFATNGYFLFVPADSGDDYQLIGLEHVADSTGTYSYSTSGASGVMSLDDSVNGPLTLNVFFSSPFQGKYAVNVGPYAQTGDVTGFTNPVPSSIAGEAFNITVTDGGAPFAASGAYTLATAASGNTYTIIPGGGNGTTSHGTYVYAKVNSTCGGITLTDSVTGASTAYLSLTNADSGAFMLTQSSDSYQIGSVSILPILNLTANGSQILVSWTTNAAGFSLQSSASLSASIWSAAASPVIVGSNYVSTEVISGDAMFYRLKK